MSDFKVTFVTAFFDLNELRPNEKSIKTYITHFISLAYSGIPLCLYTCHNIAKRINNEDSNIFTLHTIKLYIVKQDTLISDIIKSYNGMLQLPANRNINKDTYKYMILINSKVEYLYKATINNPFNTEHFAWIDFGIFHIIKGSIEKTQCRLYQIATTSYKIGSLIIPGCWNKEYAVKYNLYNNINWRFCGGFLLGSNYEIHRFYKLYLTQLKIFLDMYKTLVWEVNFWLWLELEAQITVDWYLADHNDSMLDIPSDFVSEHIILPKGLRNRLRA